MDRKKGFYEKYIKRLLDIICSLLAIVVFSWLYAIIAVIVRVKMGSPVLFKQPRPGIVKNGKETIFDMYKFRTMTNERDENGDLLPDDKRLPAFGAWLRKTSLDELPEAINILKGDMSVIGPRPQLVRDMVFMTEEQRHRHDVRPGLSGLAQINGRNSISWDDKLALDLEYLKHISFGYDTKIVLMTVGSVWKRKDITEDDHVTASDYGDVLLADGRVTRQEYLEKQREAERLLAEVGF